MTLFVKHHRTAADLPSELLKAWQNFAPTPMQSPAWMLPWERFYGTANSELLILEFHDACGQIAGVAPLQLRSSWKFGNQLRLLASGRACSDFQSLVCRPGFEEAVCERFVEWLCGEFDGKWDLLELDGIESSSCFHQLISSKLASRRCRVHTSQLFHTWRLNLSAGWEPFLTDLAKTQRRQSRNLLNRFEKSSEYRFHIASRPEELEEVLPVCIDLHQRRWQAAKHSGCFDDPKFTQFFTAACRELANSGQLRIASILHEEKTVGAVILFQSTESPERPQTWYLYQSGRDPEFNDARIGQTLTLLTVREACERGVGEIDYLRGDEIYKQRLRAVPTPCLRLRAFAPHALPTLRYGAFRVGKLLKDHLKTWRASPPSCPDESEANCENARTREIQTESAPLSAAD